MVDTPALADPHELAEQQFLDEVLEADVVF